jgi:protein gp37
MVSMDAAGGWLSRGRLGKRWTGVVAGGEIGVGARPMQPQWVRELRDKSSANGVPFLFRQWGEWAPTAGSGGRMMRVGKRAAGRVLDGRSWDQIPATDQGV